MGSHEEGFFPARDGLRLFYRRFGADGTPKAILALVHGYLEHSGRYAALAEHFRARGYTVYAYDQRGHGRSAGPRGFARAFEDYTGELGELLAKIRSVEGQGSKLFLVGHSFGGLVSLTYVLEGRNGVAGIAVSSPYLRNKVPVSGVKLFAAKLLSRVAPTLALDANVDPRDLSHDPAIVSSYAHDAFVLQKFTTRWSTITLEAQERALRRAPELKLPCLMMQAADDRVADPQGTRDFFQRLTTPDRDLKLYDGLYHEIFNELGRERVIRDLEEWLEARVK